MTVDERLLTAKRTILALPPDEKLKFAIEILEDVQRKANETHKELIECKARIKAARKINNGKNKAIEAFLEEDEEELWKAYLK